MANTYTQLYIHLVFAVWGRYHLISEKHEEEIYKYMSGIIINKGNKIMIVSGMPDHVHILMGLHPSVSISNLAMEVKSQQVVLLIKTGWQGLNLIGKRVMERSPTAERM